MTLTHCDLEIRSRSANLVWIQVEDPKQGYYCAKFEKSRLNSIHEQANDKVFVISEKTSITSGEYAQK